MIKQEIILLAVAATCLTLGDGRLNYSEKNTFQPIQPPIQIDTRTENEDYSNNLTEKFSSMPILGSDQAFPIVNTTRMDLNEDHVTGPSSSLDTLLPQNTSVKQRTTTSHYGHDDEVVALPINVNSSPEIHQYGRISEELRQDILHQFDTITSDLQDLGKFVSSNEYSNNKSLKEKPNHNMLQRLIRSLPVDDSPVCEVELITLTNLRDEVQATLEITNHPGNNNCPLNYVSNTCEELVKLVLCGYNHLKNGFIEATKNNKVAIDEATVWENKLKEYEEMSTRLLDDKITSHSQTYNQVIDKLKADMQTLQKKANFYLKTIKGDGAEVCAYRITNGNIQGAREKFIQLRDEFAILEEVIIQSIIRTVYKLELVDNIISFINELPTCNQDKIAYPALFDEMHKNNHLTNPVVLIVSDAVKQCMRDSSLDNKFTYNVNKVIDAWASKVRSYKDYEQIKEFYLKYNEIFIKHLPSLIKAAYYLKDVENILKYLLNQGYWNVALTGLSSLYENMKNNNDLDSHQLLMFAYSVHRLMKATSYHKLSDYYKNKATTLKNSLPSSVRGLIWNGHSCTIRNRERWEYLYASRLTHDRDRRHVFTWIPGNIDPDAYWKLEARGNAESFTIKSTLWEEYLYASGIIPKRLEIYEETSDGSFHGYRDTDHDGRRYVFTWKKDKEPVIESSWQLTPVDNGEYFKIKNTHWHEYLYADGAYRSYLDRRYVFTWRVGIPEGVMERESEWIIDC